MTDDALAEQAAGWLVRLGSDDDAERASAQAGFDAWKRADPRHAEAAAEIESLLNHLQAVRGPKARPARVALNTRFAQSRQRRRNRVAAVAVALAVLIAGPAALTLDSHTPRYFTADMRTATGAWQSYTLQDGSVITLDSGSAVNLHFDQQRRTVELVRGAINVTVAKDASRPFVVETAQGEMRALGTRFMVEREAGATTLSMLESKVAARAAANPRAVVVQAGERVRITADAVGALEPINAGAVDYAWQRHKLAVEDRPLGEVLAQLNRYRAGRISFDAAQLEGIRVSAVLPLDDTDRALQLLLNNFPQLRMRRFTQYWVMVDAPPKEISRK
nr:FecR domain-containing protein [uncultured Duganella sp.]